MQQTVAIETWTQNSPIPNLIIFSSFGANQNLLERTFSTLAAYNL